MVSAEGVMIPVDTKESADLLDCNSLCSPLWWRASARQAVGRGEQGAEPLEAYLSSPPSRDGARNDFTRYSRPCWWPRVAEDWTMSRFLNVEKGESR